MGKQEVESVDNVVRARQFSQHVLRDVRALDYMLREGQFESDVHRIGVEQESFLIDGTWQAAPVITDLLERVDDPRVTTELGRFNIEFNLDPITYEGPCFSDLEDQLRDVLQLIDEAAHDMDVRPMLIGILPTLRLSDLQLDSMTPKKRYHALNDRLCHLHDGRFRVHIRGADELNITHDSVMLEACNTSFQVHFQVDPDEFPKLYNVAQVGAAPILAASGNAPLAFGRRLWNETRIALFQQSIDTRRGSLYLREMSPRVTFGNKWVRESVLEIFKEDISRFPAVITTPIEENPLAMLAEGEIPSLQALQVHNGTVYRWNRACYGITDGKPHLRIENRVMPSGPTVVDEVANAAFWFGMVGGLAEEYGDPREIMEFQDAEYNFLSAARVGLDARFRWIDGEHVSAPDLIQERLLPLARASLQDSEIDRGDIDRYLGIIESRVESRQTGSQWLVQSWSRLRRENSKISVMNSLVSLYQDRQDTGAPVHSWELASPDEVENRLADCLYVEQCMSTDLFTVSEEEVVDLVGSIMDWQNLRHVPVENDEHELVGMISVSTLLNAFVKDPSRDPTEPIPVREVMERDPVSVNPDTTILEAVRVMREHGTGGLPVIQEDGQLVGVLTEWDLTDVLAYLLEKPPNTA